MIDPPEGEDRFAAGSVGSGMVAAGISTTIVALVFVVLRIFTRAHIVRRSLGIDDLIELGVGSHFWQVKYADYDPGFLIYGTCTTMTYSLTVVLAKLSLLFLYLRLCPDQSFRIVVMTLIGIVTAYSIAYQLLSLFGCRPVYASWDAVALKTASCVDKETVYMVLSIANIIMDIVILMLPLKIVIPLQMARRQKASVILLFATGTFVCAAAIKRTIILPPLMKSLDYSWDVAEQFNWSFVEANAGTVCASVPGLKPFFMRYLPSFISSRITGSSNRTGIKSLPYNTVIENNKKRRNMQSESYELQSQEDISEGGSGKVDDETKLWSGRVLRKDATNHREIVIQSGGNRDTDSSFANLSVAFDGREINVTHETEVSYSK
ncbi:integral membrane protein [Colletotrichum chrysophilum]|uniref:Integral membrane protein n=1 Tax=Colletotrichum chrysophilum TaxID=1836956 RepID=A0AAD9AXV7_9PEZI|nr:integral membrane protein [Colletotrichum chrysophilum]